MRPGRVRVARRQIGLTLIELMVALAIGSFLMVGAIQIYNQSRHAFGVNESIARVQETAQFAMDTIEADLRMASNWGLNSRALAVEGRAIVGDANPTNLLNLPAGCGADWASNLAIPIDGNNNGYTLACAGVDGAVANSDVITIRRASVNPVAPAADRLQIQSTRIQGQIFEGGIIPSSFVPAASATHNLLVSSYYVAPVSTLIGNVPTLRRQRLGVGPGIIDEEVAPGVENIQLQLGIDIDQDNTVDRYVNPGHPIYDPASIGYVPGARVMTARIWMVVRGIELEPGVLDAHDYEPGDVDLGVINDNFRRMQVSKTILLRNART